jgi:Glycosyl hydrolases family 25
MGIYGQDWASYQSTTPDTSGLSFAFVKITEGLTYINPKWVQQRDHAKANGLVWGGYAYPHMANSPQTEADFFLSQVAWKPGDIVVLDWEGYDAANSSVPKSQQRAYKDAWLRYVKSKLPYNPVGLYANTDYWLNVDTSSYYGDFLWIADYQNPAGQPGIRASWLFHQYASSPVDKDYCPLASTAALRSWALSFQPTPTPPPTPRYTEDDMLAYLPPIAANSTVDVPVEPAGTLTAPQGGANNGPVFVCLAPQGDGQVTTMLHQGGTWGSPSTSAVTVAGGKLTIVLPTDGSVDKVRISSTVPLLGYVVGRQVA